MPFRDATMRYRPGLCILNEYIDEGVTFDLEIDLIRAGLFVRDAPTGSSLIVTPYINNVANAQTVSIADGSTSGNTTFSPVITVTAGQQVEWRLTQIGSTLPGMGIALWFSWEP